MDRGIGGRTALVTGAAGPVGAATTAALLAEDVRVVMVDVDQAGLDEVVSRLPAGVETPLTVVSDLATDEAVLDLARTVAEVAGEVDILVTAAASTVVRGLFHEVDDAAWVAAAGDLLGAVRVTRALLPALRHGGWGRVVYVDPAGGRRRDAGLPADVTGGALLALAEGLSRTYADDGLVLSTLPPAVGPGRPPE